MGYFNRTTIEHYKMYKKGKIWVSALLISVSLLGGICSLNIGNVHAAITDKSALFSSQQDKRPQDKSVNGEVQSSKINTNMATTSGANMGTTSTAAATSTANTGTTSTAAATS
uniref:KxYKxGKxW signal peptide domain-containing protein n=1 Tax=Loigolactobacillus iwatensis TaxID=1267156 RepID=UPI001430E44F